MLIATVFLIVIAYLLGSLSSAVLISKVLKLPDPRSEGSGNPGATNILRIGGKFPAIVTLLGDGLKGVVPVALGAMAGLGDFSLCLIALAAVLGHIFPVFFDFKGGKGVATAFGAFLVVNVWVGVLAIVTWLIVTVVSRYVSLASLVAVWLAAFFTMILVGFGPALPIILIACLVTWKHGTNIKRLQEGKENKIKLQFNK